MKRAGVPGVVLLAVTVGGCNVLLGNDPWTLAGAADGGDASTRDGGADDDGSGSDDGSNPADGSGNGDVVATETGLPETSPETGGQDSGLSSLLVLPAAGPACDPSQGDVGCPTGTSCRIATSTSGRCDGTTAGHEGSFPCAADSDCDDGLQCYNGDCHVLCPLGSPCSGGCECYPVGNVSVGICCPGA